MKFSEASAFPMPYGKYFGRTLDDIASTDAGLLYLDWVRGITKPERPDLNPLYLALRAYLDDPTISKDVAELSGRGAQS